MAKILYQDKVTIDPKPEVAAINKLTATDANEIKNSVNAAYDQIDAQGLEITEAQSAITGLGEDVVDLEIGLSAHEANTSNPHSVTASQLPDLNGIIQTAIENISPEPSTEGLTEYSNGVVFGAATVGNTIYNTVGDETNFYLILQAFTASTIEADITANNIRLTNPKQVIIIEDFEADSTVLYGTEKVVKHPDIKSLIRAQENTTGASDPNDTDVWEEITYSGRLTPRVVTAPAYTVTAANHNELVIRTNDAAVTEIPNTGTEVLPIGWIVNIQRNGDSCQIVFETGISVIGPSNTDGDYFIELDGGAVTVICTGVNEFSIIGNLEL